MDKFEKSIVVFTVGVLFLNIYYNTEFLKWAGWFLVGIGLLIQSGLGIKFISEIEFIKRNSTKISFSVFIFFLTLNILLYFR